MCGDEGNHHGRKRTEWPEGGSSSVKGRWMHSASAAFVLLYLVDVYSSPAGFVLLFCKKNRKGEPK